MKNIVKLITTIFVVVVVTGCAGTGGVKKLTLAEAQKQERIYGKNPQFEVEQESSGYNTSWGVSGSIFGGGSISNSVIKLPECRDMHGNKVFTISGCKKAEIEKQRYENLCFEKGYATACRLLEKYGTLDSYNASNVPANYNNQQDGLGAALLYSVLRYSGNGGDITLNGGNSSSQGGNSSALGGNSRGGNSFSSSRGGNSSSSSRGGNSFSGAFAGSSSRSNSRSNSRVNVNNDVRGGSVSSRRTTIHNNNVMNPMQPPHFHPPQGD